jgi:hypothetical protein
LLKESVPPGFGEPEDWFSEDPGDIEATNSVHDFFENLVTQG